MIWLDIEGPQYWSKDQQANRDFFSGLVSALQTAGEVIGVYTSASQWIPIMGDWDGGAHFPLWCVEHLNIYVCLSFSLLISMYASALSTVSIRNVD